MGKAICTRVHSRARERWKVGAGVPVRVTAHVVFTRKRYKQPFAFEAVLSPVAASIGGIHIALLGDRKSGIRRTQRSRAGQG
jgi:hypothetical protein